MRLGAYLLVLCSFLAISVLLWEPYTPGSRASLEKRAHTETEPARDVVRAPLKGNADRLAARYAKWKAGLVATGRANRVVLDLSWSKGRSSEYSNASGTATLDLEGRTISIDVAYLPPEETGLDAWLVEYRPGMGAEYDVAEDEVLVHLGTMEVEDGHGSFTTSLGPELRDDFELEQISLSRAGTSPSEGGLLFGSPDLFQRVYSSEHRATAAAAERAERRAVGGLLLALAPMMPLLDDTFPGPSPDETFPELVARGEELFCRETFLGNGRTCCTCHPFENNFTIEPLFIATLPASDPLFVAETVPALDSTLNGGLVFESPKLMREFGLIVENLDGFGDLKTRFTMRSVPHTLGLPVTMTTPDGGLKPPNQRTGWSGDGAPNNGTLRDFATGAVTQHFPKTLARDPTSDFRLPTPDELTALEAFQLSLGRDKDPQLAAMTFLDPGAERGKDIFNDPGAGKCAGCHFNAGANAGFTSPAGTQNFNFNTGVEAFTQNHPDGTGLPRPPDGGFGLNPQGDFTALIPGPDGSFGDGTFNSTSLVELADTLPAFHSNITNIPGSGLTDTVEGSIEFYNTVEFQNSPSGQAIGGISLSATQVDQIGAFLRVLNALDNERATRELAVRAKTILQSPNPDIARSEELLVLATFDAEDAIQVLAGANLHMHARTDFHKARQRLLQATHGPIFHRINKIDDALALLQDARDKMVIE